MMQKLVSVLLLLPCFVVQAQRKEVPPSLMQQMYAEVKTPYKYGLVITPADETKKVDCPSVFREGKNWYMTYIVFNGRGYETWLAKSANLLEWKTLGKLMSSSDSADWDGAQKAGYVALQDTKWGGSYQWQPFNGKYWMSYFGGKDSGYEAGPLSIGIASTTGSITSAHEWNRASKPVLTSADSDVRWWENKKTF